MTEMSTEIRWISQFYYDVGTNTAQAQRKIFRLIVKTYYRKKRAKGNSVAFVPKKFYLREVPRSCRPIMEISNLFLILPKKLKSPNSFKHFEGSWL